MSINVASRNQKLIISFFLFVFVDDDDVKKMFKNCEKCP
jgi:hypothetical protein